MASAVRVTIWPQRKGLQITASFGLASTVWLKQLTKAHRNQYRKMAEVNIIIID